MQEENNQSTVCSKCGRVPVWYDFIYTKEWGLVMSGVKISAVLLLAWLVWILFSDFKALEILNYDACAYCMEKTGAQCFKVQFP